MTRLAATLALLIALAAPAAFAAPQPYALDAAASEVGFVYRLTGQATRGRMPVSRAEIVIDWQSLAATRADVTLDVARAQAGLIFATQAMRGPQVLDAGRHPAIRFRSTRTYATEGGAAMEGALTVRGVTRPVTLAARFLAPQGAAPDDPAARERLTIELTGAISRSAFGASGFPDIVGDRVDLEIRAVIRRQ
jgi:polyisoprenoid-binding protein YceI